MVAVFSCIAISVISMAAIARRQETRVTESGSEQEVLM